MMSPQPTRQRRTYPLLAMLAALALTLLLAACGGDTTGNGAAGPTASPTPESIDHPTSDDEMILSIAFEGGFVTPDELVRRLPLFALIGDGCVISQGPQIAIYPPPALPNLRQTCLTEEGVQAILRAAKEAGLLDGDAQYDNPSIADAPTTVFTVTANGTTTTVKAYALGDGTHSTGTPEADAARQKLVEFQNKLGDLTSWVPAEAFVGEEQPYEVTRLQLVVQPASGEQSAATPAAVDPQHKEWPLATPLAELGQPYPFEDWRCAVVEGDDLATLLEQLASSNQLTRWSSGDADYTLVVRPLLPGEPACANPM